jgi:hypothetical protein
MDKTSTKRQSQRTAALDAIAQRAGWHSWSVYERNVKNGVVTISKNPNPEPKKAGPHDK